MNATNARNQLEKRTFTGVLNQSEQKYDTWLFTCQRIVKILFDPKKYIR